MENKREILLESGTNELEIVEFGIGKNHFGINVIKVREIINPCFGYCRATFTPTC